MGSTYRNSHAFHSRLKRLGHPGRNRARRRNARVFLPGLLTLEGRTLLTVTPLLGVPGMTINDGGPVEPPDTIVASGPEQLVELVNTAITVVDKTTGARLSTQSLYAFFPVKSGDSLSDPFATYDEMASRFVLGILEYNGSTQKSYYDFAVSNGADASSGFTEKQQIDITETVGGQGLLADFPRLGWDHDAYVATFNEFSFTSGNFVNVQVLSIEKSAVLDQNSTTLVSHRLYRDSSNATLVPAVMHGAATNAPIWFVEEGTSANSLRFVSMSTVPGTTPTFTDYAELPVAAYAAPPLAAQPGGGTIQTNDSRILSVAWRNNVLVAAQNVGTGGLAHARWYVFSTAAAPPTLTQYGEIAPGPGVSTYFPAIDIAPDGDLGLTYMESSASEYMSVYVTGRTASDPTGTLQTPVLGHAGTASYSGSRAGDFSGVSADPNPGSQSFWAASEYSAGSPLWSTWIQNFSLGGEWSSYNHDPQHTGLAQTATQPISALHWSTPVDLNPQYSGSDLLIHYGSPVVTPANTVIIPVKTGASGGFELQARAGDTGALKWTHTTDYALPPSGYSWTPSYSATLTSAGTLYYPGLGGTVYRIDSPDSSVSASTQIAFYGTYTHAADTTVFLNTPITADAAGDIFFGFQTFGTAPGGLTSGIARIDPTGKGTWVAVSALPGNTLGVSQVVDNAAPALSNDGQTLYVPVSTGNFGQGYLVALDSTTLTLKSKVALVDPSNGNLATLPNDGSASPTVGPDGDVYFGVLETPFASHHDRGWLLHFSADLATTKTPGSFGWDDTASIVPARLVPSYHGTSTYLVLTKYNDYANYGSGFNKLAILDPNATQADPINGTTAVMQEVLTIAGVTPDANYSNKPGAVREWCINAAVVDAAGDCVMVNSEDGRLYAWDLSTNTFTQAITLEPATGEAYTPTFISPDGTVYAINNAVLHAVGMLPAPDLDFSGGFSMGTAGELTFNGGAAVSGSRLRLTDGGASEARSVFTTAPQSIAAFTTNVSFQINPGANTADGFTFTLQGAGNTALGSSSAGLGYASIAKSLAVKFDLYSNAGEGNDSTGVYTNGASPTTPADSLVSSGIDLHSGDVLNATIAYDGSNLTLTLTDPTTNKTFTKTYTGYNIPQLVGGSTAYVGFTGGTGVLTATQDILAWTYTPGTPAVPAAPLGLAVTATGYTGTSTAPTPLGAYLTWDAVAGATSYKLERKLGSTGTFTQIATIPSSSLVMFDDTGLTASSTYSYRVRASNSVGDSAYSSVISVGIPAPTVPAAPSGGSVTATTTTLSLTWTDNASNEDGYQIFRGAGGGPFSLLLALPPNATKLIDPGLTPGTAYDYHVVAYDLAGPSTVLDVPGTTRTLAPTGLSATAGVSSITLAWTAPAGVVATYNVYRGTASGGESLYKSGVTTSSYTDTGVSANTTYYYTVAAVNAGGESAPSSEVSATVIGSSATLDFSSGFATGTAGVLTFNGGAAVSGSRLRITDGGSSEARSVFTTAPQSIAGFTTNFAFQINPGATTADGFTFTIEGVGNTALGSRGGGLGYASIAKSLAVKFDLYNNAGEGNDSTGVYTNGASPTTPNDSLVTSGVDLHSGDVMNATISYDGTSNLKLTITDTVSGASFTKTYTGYNIPQLVGASTAYVGFTGGTGGISATQDILAWTYVPNSTVPPPAAPQNLTGSLTGYTGTSTAATPLGAHLTWSTVAGATGYKVERKLGTSGTYAQIGTTTSPVVAYDDSGLAAQSTYVYRVRATSAGGDGAYSSEVTLVTPAVPAAPSGGSVTTTTTTLALAWTDNATSEDGYQVFRSTGGGPFTLLLPALPANTITFTDPGLTPGTAYDYHVVAYNLAGPSTVLDVPGTTRTLAPTGLSATAGVSSITLAWTAPAGVVATYNVYRGTASGGESLYKSGVTTSSYTDTGVSANTTYYYTVAAVNAGGESTASNEISATISAAAQTTTIDDSVLGTSLNQFNYVGNWSLVTNTSIPNCYQGTVTITDATNDYATLSFSGTQVKFYAALRSNRGIVAISIDGGPETLVDEYAAQDAGNVLVYTSPVLASGIHTIKIRNTGTHNVNSGGTRGDIDRIDVISG